MKKPNKSVLLAELAKCDEAMANITRKMERGFNDIAIILEMRHWTEKAKLIQSML